MTKFLILDDQDWVVNFYSKVLIREDLIISTPDDINSVDESITSFEPDLVLINLDLKDGANADDVVWKIKMKYPYLPVLIVAPYDTYLYNARLFQKNPYFIKGCVAPEELIQEIDTVLKQKHYRPNRDKITSNYFRNGVLWKVDDEKSYQKYSPKDESI